ncbi:hypothetical protein IF1G_02746 [Cordyceps javanica]|uniref:Uncharacterized protein n=1 Tax=Cordyceps javanica TaxID=43265 RepID=A0A545VAA3_9HYPO|nr:hypothetical protein IF1G_02746 [Cordyceps javanica]
MGEILERSRWRPVKKRVREVHTGLWRGIYSTFTPLRARKCISPRENWIRHPLRPWTERTSRGLGARSRLTEQDSGSEKRPVKRAGSFDFRERGHIFG